MRASLATSGHTLHVAPDGEQGLALVMSLRPALVLTDLSMPKLDGMALAKRLRASPELAQIPVIFISASVSRMRELAQITTAPPTVLTKPFSPADLRAVVAAHLDAKPG